MRKLVSYIQSNRPCMHATFLGISILLGFFAVANSYSILSVWIEGEGPLRINSTTFSLVALVLGGIGTFFFLHRLYQRPYFASRAYTRFIGNGLFMLLLSAMAAATNFASPALYRPFLQSHDWERCIKEENPDNNPADNWEVWYRKGNCPESS